MRVKFGFFPGAEARIFENDGLKKEHSVSKEDKILLYKLYIKLKKEFQDLDKSKL